jgi:hypothetical protein
MGVERQDHTLAGNALSTGGQYRRVEDGRGVDAYFVRRSSQDQAHILCTADTTAHGKGQEDLICHAAHHIGNRLLPGRAGDDVQERQLIGAHPVIRPGLLDRVAGIAQIDEVNTFDNAPVLYIQARDDAPG